MPTPYRHRKSRLLHDYRYGRAHYRLHRQGIRHRHRRGQRPQREVRISRWRLAPRRMWPKEIARQAIIGVALGLAIVLIGAVILAVVAFLDARGDISKAQQIAHAIVGNRHELLSPAGRGEVSLQLAQMHDDASLADHTLTSSPAISLLKYVPFLGTQVTAMTDEVADVDDLASQGQSLLRAAINTIAASHGTSISLPQLKLLDIQVHASARALVLLERPASGLWGPARTERIKINGVLQNIVALLKRGGRALDFAQPFLGSDGPRVYLVVGQNNSEMRDQGAVLSWALLHVDNGHFTMSSASSVGTISLRRPAATITSAATREAFGDLDPTEIWQSVNANGDFPTSARWMMAMFKAARGITVDGVVGVDVRTLANILSVSGDVRVPDIHGKVTGSNVASLLLYDLYTKYPEGSQAARHDDITEVAQAAVTKMGHVHYDLGAFLDALAKSSQGRHLLFYDANPALQRVVTSFGGSGALRADGPDDIHLAVEAGVAAKLDWFLHTSVTYNIRVDTQGTAYITTTLLMHNSAPADVPGSYALGPDNVNSHVEGEYIARVYEWLPPGATSPGAIPDEEGLSLLRAVQPVFAQQSEEVIFSAIWPDAVRHGVLRLHFIPQSLIHTPTVQVEFSAPGNYSGPPVTTWSANHPVTLTWRTNP